LVGRGFVVGPGEGDGWSGGDGGIVAEDAWIFADLDGGESYLVVGIGLDVGGGGGGSVSGGGRGEKKRVVSPMGRAGRSF